MLKLVDLWLKLEKKDLDKTWRTDDMSQRKDYKYKHGVATRRNFNKAIHMEELTVNKPKDKVREDFYRPAYGKIGERRGDKDGEC